MGWNGRLSADGADSRRLGRKPVKSAKSAEKGWFCRFGGAPQRKRGVARVPAGEVFVPWGASRMKRGATPPPRGASRGPRGAARTIGGAAPAARGAPRRVGASSRRKRGAPHGAADAPHGKRGEAPGAVGLTGRSAWRRRGSTALPFEGIDFRSLRTATMRPVEGCGKAFRRLLRRCAVAPLRRCAVAPEDSPPVVNYPCR